MASRDNSDGHGSGHPAPREHTHPEANEHTRLLPSRIESASAPQGGYLSPDDPAVSPYNLWTVRLVRRVTVFFAALAFAWWLVLLVSAFVTPPGLHTRGGTWFGFSYASVALVTLAVALLFFAAPSRGSRILSVALAGILVGHLVIITAVPGVRHEESSAGIAACAWAMLMAAWALLADRTVDWGKTEEERRLTGRPDTRRTLLEWTEVLLSGVVLGVLGVAVVLMTMTLLVRALDQGLEAPGERVWVDGGKYRIHLYCSGNRTSEQPTVFLEGGEDAVENGLWQLADSMLKNGTIARYCFADRPGVAWSDTAPSPLSASIASDVLGEALAHAGEPGPWILLSAGIGSIYSRVFSSRHNEDVRGLLLVDPFHEDLLYRIGAPELCFWLWLRGVLSPLGIDRIPGAVFRGRSSADRVWGVSAYQNGKIIFAKLQESLVADSLTKRDVVSSRAIQRKQTPLVVISSGVEMRASKEWEQKQRDLTRVTEKLEGWHVVDEAPHQVWKTLKGRDAIEQGLKKLAST